jgi:hypothetical protein
MEAAMNKTKTPQEIKMDGGGTDKQDSEANTLKSALTVSQRAAIGFTAGVIGAAAVVACSYVLFGLGVSGALA